MSSNQLVPLILCCAVVHGRHQEVVLILARGGLALRTQRRRGLETAGRADGSILPTGSSSPKSCSTTVRPSTQTLAETVTSC